MISSGEIKKISRVLILSLAIVGLVKFFHFIPSFLVFSIILLFILLNFYRNFSGVLVFLAFSGTILATVPNIFLSLSTYFVGQRYANLLSTVSLVLLISFFGGKLLVSSSKEKRLYVLSLLIACVIAVFMFKEPLIYEADLSTLCFLIISIIGLTLGGSGHCHINIKRLHTIIFLGILVLAFLLSNVFIKRPLNNVGLIECFNEWANTDIDYTLTNISLEGGYSYSLMKKILEHKYTLFTVKDRARLKDTLSQVQAAIIMTPTVPPSPQELNDLLAFVASGGRLVVIADHTDVYGHGRVLNGLLSQADCSVEYNALFDSNDYYADVRLLNMPMLSIRPKTPCSFRIGKFGYVFAWADNWISESADYARPNFFGELIWTSDDLVGNWPVGAITTYKKGIVVTWGDSTIFANFCIFQPGHLRLLGTLLEGGEMLAHLIPFSLLLLAVFCFCISVSRLCRNDVIAFCSLGLIIFSGSYYLWDFDEQRFYPVDKRIDIYGGRHLFNEPPPKRLPGDFQFSSAYSHIARCGLWPLYRGEKPTMPAPVKSIWVTPWSQLKTIDSNVLKSLWGVVINEVDEEMDGGFKSTFIDNNLPDVFREYFLHSVRRKIWVAKDNSHTLFDNGVSIFIADGTMTDSYLGDWWITTRISPYRQYMLSEFFGWLVRKGKISMFHYPTVGVLNSEKDWIVKFENKEHANIKMQVERYEGDREYVYIGSSIWSLYEKNKDGEFLVGGPELSDDSSKSGSLRWAAQAVNKAGNVK